MEAAVFSQEPSWKLDSCAGTDGSRMLRARTQPQLVAAEQKGNDEVKVGQSVCGAGA